MRLRLLPVCLACLLLAACGGSEPGLKASGAASPSSGGSHPQLGASVAASPSPGESHSQFGASVAADPSPGESHSQLEVPVAAGPSPGESHSQPGASVPASPPSSGPHPRLGAPGPVNPPSGGIVLGRTTDELGQPHALVLDLAPDVQQAVLQSKQIFAVVSGSTRFSVTGDAAAGAWRFVVDSRATGDAAPIVVLKEAAGSVKDLAADPSRFAFPAELNDDWPGTSARLNALIATVISKAELPNPDGALYGQLARTLQDPAWTGMLVFNATVSAIPGEVQGQSTGSLAGTQVAAYDIGFNLAPVGGGIPPAETFFATVDDTWAASDAPPGIQYLRALFTNSALAYFELGKD